MPVDRRRSGAFLHRQSVNRDLDLEFVNIVRFIYSNQNALTRMQATVDILFTRQTQGAEL